MFYSSFLHARPIAKVTIPIPNRNSSTIAATRQQVGVVDGSSSLMCHTLPVTVRSYVSIVKTCRKHFPMLNAQNNVGAEQTQNNSHKQWVCSQCKLRSTCPDLSIRSSVACFTVDLANALSQAGCQHSKHQEQRMIEPFSCPACLWHLAHTDGCKAWNASALRQAMASQKKCGAALASAPSVTKSLPSSRTQTFLEDDRRVQALWGATERMDQQTVAPS